MDADIHVLVINALRLRQAGRHFADDILKCIFSNETVSISIQISLKFIPDSPFSNIPALVQIMVWRLPGNKPLSEPMLTILLTHVCVNSFRIIIKKHWSFTSLAPCKGNPLWTMGFASLGLMLKKTKPHQCRHCLHTRNLNSDSDYLLIFICKQSQHAGC